VTGPRCASAAWHSLLPFRAQVLSRPSLRLLAVDGCAQLTPDVAEILKLSAMDLLAPEGEDGSAGGLRLCLVPVRAT
jgi:hypothetical protein